MTIRVGIVGYGNLGKGAEAGIKHQEDMELVGVFTRRPGIETISGAPVYSMEQLPEFQGKIDVMILCGGSATDLMEQGPLVAQWFHTIDSFDTHPRIPEYFEKMDKAAKENGHAAIISVGWDPGLFSLQRVLAESILPQGKGYTFWGSGVSQGHSDAIRRIPGVKNAKQYTIPRQEIMEEIRSGGLPDVKGNEAHIRDCYVVAEEGADKAAIEEAIKTMPNYFVGYETHVTFMEEGEFLEKHSGIPHGGFVMHSGETENGNNHVYEFSLKLDSNPEFTSSVLLAYARAIVKLAGHGGKGAFSVLDIPFAWLSAKSPEELRKTML